MRRDGQGRGGGGSLLGRQEGVRVPPGRPGQPRQDREARRGRAVGTFPQGHPLLPSTPPLPRLQSAPPIPRPSHLNDAPRNLLTPRARHAAPVPAAMPPHRRTEGPTAPPQEPRHGPCTRFWLQKHAHSVPARTCSTYSRQSLKQTRSACSYAHFVIGYKVQPKSHCSCTVFVSDLQRPKTKNVCDEIFRDSMKTQG